jgi:hypothetical protein
VFKGGQATDHRFRAAPYRRLGNTNRPHFATVSADVEIGSIGERHVGIPGVVRDGPAGRANGAMDAGPNSKR